MKPPRRIPRRVVIMISGGPRSSFAARGQNDTPQSGYVPSVIATDAPKRLWFETSVALAEEIMDTRRICTGPTLRRSFASCSKTRLRAANALHLARHRRYFRCQSVTIGVAKRRDAGCNPRPHKTPLLVNKRLVTTSNGGGGNRTRSCASQSACRERSYVKAISPVSILGAFW